MPQPFRLQADKYPLVVLRKCVFTYIIQGLIAINDNNSRCGASFPRAEKRSPDNIQ